MCEILPKYVKLLVSTFKILQLLGDRGSAPGTSWETRPQTPCGFAPIPNLLPPPLPKRWWDVISHLFGAGPVCLLPTRQRHCSVGATEHGLSCSLSAVALSSGAVCAASEESVILEGRVGRRFCRSWCAPSRTLCQFCLLSGMASLSLGCWTDGPINAQWLPLPPTHSMVGSGQHV